MRTIKRDIVGAVIISKDGKIFFAQKTPKSGGVYSDDCWHIPGGGLEEGESKEAGVIREVKEETGIDIASDRIKFIGEDNGESEKTLKDSGERVLVKMRFHNYQATLEQEAEEVRVELNDEFSSHCWYAPEELANVKLTPPEISLFKRLGYLQ